MVSLLHTADWQIGKQFANIPDDAGAFVRAKRIDAVKTIGRIAEERNVDAVLVAGDVFETNLVQAKTILQTIRAMAETFSGKWIIIPGNHDSAEVSSVWTRIKEGFGSENIVLLVQPEPYYLRHANTVILPAPLQRRHDARDLTVWFDDFVSDPNMIRIGLAHGSIDNRLSHRGEAPNTISDTRSETAKLDYFALGDWHGTMNIAPRTWYSGTPEPDRFKENESGNILFVEIEGPGKQPKVEKIQTGHFRWLQQELRIFQNEDFSRVKQMLVETAYPLNQILLRLTLEGAVSLETRSIIMSELDALSAELCFIETDDSKLLAEPTSEDLDDIERTGFVRKAVDELVLMAKNSEHPDSETARFALQLLYVEHKNLGATKC
ncbi:MAG: DNA repair exonuclease [Candidatus Melainabacteria bacterium]|nr:DNA repair exonuclease [Candidatus Melainabacteria bacterium]